jgi:hypothetical protein
MRFVLTLSLLFASSCLADHVLRNAHAHARHARRAVNSTSPDDESTSDDAIDLAKRGGARFTYFQVGLYVPHLCLRLLRGSLILVARALWQLEVLVGATIRIATMCAFASRGCVAARFSGFVLTLYVVSDRGAELTSTHILSRLQIRIPRTYVCIFLSRLSLKFAFLELMYPRNGMADRIAEKLSRSRTTVNPHTPSFATR